MYSASAMSRRQSLKNLSDSFSSQKSLRINGETVTKNSLLENDNKRDIGSAVTRSVDDLKKELMKLTNRRISVEKNSASVKKSSSINSSSRRIEKPASFKPGKNYSAKNNNTLTRLDSKISIVTL